MSLTVYAGPMFSGKTTKLLQEISRFIGIFSSDQLAENKILIVNSKKDTRDYRNVISSHSPFYKGLSDKIDVISSYELNEINVEKYILIGIDECNFFSDLEETIKIWLSKEKHIVCVGLDSDYRMEKFGKISDLLHLSDKFEKLNAICSCCLNDLMDQKVLITPDKTTPAPFTARIQLEQKQIEIIGGSDIYKAVCRNCHQKRFIK